MDITAKVLCASLKENSFRDIPASSSAHRFCMKLQSGLGAGETNPGEVLEKDRYIWLPFSASFKRLNFCEEQNRYHRAHTHFCKQNTALEPADHILRLIYLFHTNFCFLQDPPCAAI